MKYLIVFINLFFLIFLFSCYNNNKVEEYKRLVKKQSEVKNFSLENARSSFEMNRFELESVKSKFLDQRSIRKLIRKDIEKSLISKNEAQNYRYLIEYELTCFNGNEFSISFDSEEDPDENKFWNTKYERIINKNNNNLKEFLFSNNINEQMFQDLINFMRKNKIFSIRKPEENIYIKINFELLEGLIYFIDSAIIHGNIESTTILEKISKNWYYFKDVY